MTISTNGLLHFQAAPPRWRPHHSGPANGDGNGATHTDLLDPESLRRCAWEVGEGKPLDNFRPAANHVGLAMVEPRQGFAHWHILPEWVDRTARQKGDAWHHCRPVLRLYDVTNILFNGFNAHRIQDHTLPGLCGHLFFKTPHAGTWELAEVGFLLRNGEFLPAARSRAVPYPPSGPSHRAGNTALLIDGHGRVEEIGNVWEQERILRERRQPRLRHPLRVAAFAFASLPSGQEGNLARFVTELAAGKASRGHEVHVFHPASPQLAACREVDGVHYHPLELEAGDSPLELARSFGRAAEARLRDLPPFDLVHLHEWMTWLVPRTACPTVLSLGSVEATRRNGSEPTPLSLEVERAERAAAQAADCILTPDWLRDRAAFELDVEAGRVRAFPMEGRLPNEWERPLDFGRVKMDVGFGPLDRLMLYIGPLEHAAGVDLLIEALPVLLRRSGDLRVAFAGAGNMHGHLEHRARALGVAHAVRLLGHVEMPTLVPLLRSAEALVLPSRCRLPFDDAVVDLGRRAGRPVVTTHGGPTHLVRHEENGILTYDNPGSMVWALDRILSDPGHAQRMGHNGRRGDGGTVVWSEVAGHYLDLCAAQFEELVEVNW